MLRITLLNRTSEEEVYLLEGWIAGEEVAVLAQTCGPVVARRVRLVLDLRGVRSIDEAGLALLKHWAGPRLVLRRPSAYIRQVLENHGISVDNGDGAEQKEEAG